MGPVGSCVYSCWHGGSGNQGIRTVIYLAIKVGTVAGVWPRRKVSSGMVAANIGREER